MTEETNDSLAALGLRLHEAGVNSPNVITHALTVARYGFFVFQDGDRDSATKNPDAIKAAYKANPDANWYVLAAKGLYIIDLPSDHDRVEIEDALGSRLPRTWAIEHPYAGTQLLYRAQNGIDLKKRVRLFATSAQFKGSTALPGSMRSGEPYRWMIAPGVADLGEFTRDQLLMLPRKGTGLTANLKPRIENNFASRSRIE